MSVFRNIRTNRRGAALVEFALILPLLLLFVFGIIEFGSMLLTYQAVGQLAREGARSGALGDSAGTMNSTITTTATTMYSLVPAKIASKTYEYHTYTRNGSSWDGPTGWTEFTAGNPAPSDTNQYSQIRVTVTYNYDLITGSLFSWLVGGNTTVPLTGSVVMRKGG